MTEERYYSWEGVEVDERGDRPASGQLPVEVPLVITLNGERVAILMALPGSERELAIGFCLSEGFVASFDDILLARFCRDEESFSPRGEGRGALVEVRARPEATRRVEMGQRLILSGCGGVAVDLATLDLAPLAEQPAVRVAAARLIEMARTLRRHQGIYRRTGGVHAVGLFAPDGTLRLLSEDIGRHNAVDKVLGGACIHDQPLGDGVLLSTGRASHELVTKALRLGVPVVGSLSVPTSLAVQLAQEGGCTLLGRLRRGRFYVYTGLERIV